MEPQPVNQLSPAQTESANNLETSYTRPGLQISQSEDIYAEVSTNHRRLFDSYDGYIRVNVAGYLQNMFIIISFIVRA